MSTTYNLKVTAYSLNVRKQPTVNSQAFDWIQQNETYSASKVQNGWYYIDSLKGWVSGKYVSVEKTTTVPKASNNKPATTTTPKETPKTTTTTTNNTKNSTISTAKDKESKNYVIDVSRSAGDRLDNFKGSIGTSRGGIVVDNVGIYVSSPNPKVTTGLSVRPNGDYYSNVTGIENFSEYRSNVKIGGDPNNEISGMTEALNAARRQLSLYSADDNKSLFTKFNRFKIATPGVELGKGFPYIFFTKPDLDLLDRGTGKLQSKFDGIDHTFTYLYNNNPEIFKSLHTAFGGDHSFNNYLSNMARSFEPSDEVIRTVETGETYTGWKTVYGRNTNESNSAGQFNIQYRDSRNLDITKMHKVWIDYMNAVYRGAIEVERNLIHKKILNYACSVYYIVTAEDGETIIYWAKYYGVFPINVPTSVLGWSAGSPLKLPEFSISYMYALRDQYDPLTLAEFNTLSSGPYEYKKAYNEANAMSSASWSGAPYVDIVKKPDGTVAYKLRFRF